MRPVDLIEAKTLLERAGLDYTFNGTMHRLVVTLIAQETELAERRQDAADHNAWIAAAGDREAQLIEELHEARASAEQPTSTADESQSEPLVLQAPVTAMPPSTLADPILLRPTSRPTVRAAERCAQPECGRPLPCYWHPAGYDAVEVVLQAILAARAQRDALTPEQQGELSLRMTQRPGPS